MCEPAWREPAWRSGASVSSSESELPAKDLCCIQEYEFPIMHNDNAVPLCTKGFLFGLRNLVNGHAITDLIPLLLAALSNRKSS